MRLRPAGVLRCRGGERRGAGHQSRRRAPRHLGQVRRHASPSRSSGIVTLVDWTNPHVHVFVNVKDAKNQLLNWAVELESPIDLQQSGWNKETLEPGDAITVQGIAARNGSRQVWGRSVVVNATGRQVLNVKPMAPAAPLQARPTPLLARRPAAARRRARVRRLLGLSELDRAGRERRQGGHRRVRAAEERRRRVEGGADAAVGARRSTRTGSAASCRTTRRSSTASRRADRASSSSRYGVQFVEDRERQRIFVLIGGGNRNFRIIYTDGRGQVGQVSGDDDNPLYYGRAVGKWEGEHAGRRYARVQRGFLVHQRRAAAHRPAAADRALHAGRLSTRCDTR